MTNCRAVEMREGEEMTNQCEHGSLARTCPLCEANAEIAALRAEVERLRNKIDELNGELNRWEWGEYGL